MKMPLKSLLPVMSFQGDFENIYAGLFLDHLCFAESLQDFLYVQII